MDQAELSFEAAFAQLEAAVARLEGSDLTIDELVREFERGMALVTFCTKQLDAAQLKVTLLLREAEADGEVNDTTERELADPFD